MPEKAYWSPGRWRWRLYDWRLHKLYRKSIRLVSASSNSVRIFLPIRIFNVQKRLFRTMPIGNCKRRGFLQES